MLMPSILPFRKPAHPVTPYGQGYLDGQRAANERFFWFGVVAGLVIATAVALATLYLMGATK